MATNQILMILWHFYVGSS